jgi:tetratricopeptide (TPR) repeat protein
MKLCSQCGRTFPDAYQFCQYDRTLLTPAVTPAVTPSSATPIASNLPAGLNTVRATTGVLAERESRCKRCGASLSSRAQFCRKCGTSVPATATTTTGIDAQGGGRRFESERAINSRRRPIVIIGVTAVLLLGGFLIYKLRANPVEKKLNEAIAKGNLLTPPGANAYELYHQLKLEGGDPKTIAALDEKLRPLLTTRPIQLLKDFSVAGSKDPSPAEWEEAYKKLAWAQEIQSSDPTIDAKASYCKGRMLYLANRKDEALDAWKQAADKDKSWALPINGVGLIYNERKDYYTAREFLTEAINRDPSWAVPYNNMGTSYFYERNYDQAESYYQQAASRAPSWARPHAWLGAIAMQRKDYYSAIREFEFVVDQSSTGKENIDLGRINQQLEQARTLSQGGF